MRTRDVTERRPRAPVRPRLRKARARANAPPPSSGSDDAPCGTSHSTPAGRRPPHLLPGRARGKTHTQALLRLARHRISVLFAMLRDGTFYASRLPETAAA
ncbi:hypothetical protein GCM10023329_08240 [Streptomyces sanyensis]|uniref:Transposase n=1 Tax=Streptomyces sanyensis TaxID=568869 RepID=A0ABP8ZS73_9ACTN